MRDASLLLFVFTLAAHAQSGKAEIFGLITDSRQVSIAGAEIDLLDPATGAHFRTLSNSAGSYRILALPPGGYELFVRKPGFAVYHQTAVRLRVNDRVSIDAQLALAAVSGAIDVIAGTPLLETATGAVSFHLNTEIIENLPLDGRNFIPLVSLAPGIALPGGGSVLPRVNGSRPRTNEYIYDGISALQPEPGQVVFYPVIDALEEVNLQTSSYSPEYGRSNGGAVVLATRSGGNAFHGDLFEFFRNEALNARNYFAPPGPKPEFRRNQYGFTLGGPIVKDRAFFFLDWQGARLRTGITRFSTVPTLAQRAGVFGPNVFDPATRTPFPNNTIPAARFDPAAAQLLRLYPAPNRPGTGNNFVRTAVEPDNQDQFDLRLDHSLTADQRVFIRYSLSLDDDVPVTPLPNGSGLLTSGLISPTHTRGDQLAAEHQIAFTPALVNQLRFGYTRRTSASTGPQAGGLPLPATPGGLFAGASPAFTIAGFQQLGPPGGANSRFTTSVTEVSDTLSAVRGAHTWKFGFDLRREALDVIQPPNPAGAYAFNNAGTNKLGVAGSGNALASFLLGQVAAFSIDLQRKQLEERAHIAELFAGDEWRVTPRLSLDLGTRYTLNFPSYEQHRQGAVFNLHTQQLEFPRTARDLECCDFGPRAGIAYRLSPSLVLRAGYGLVWFEQTGITTPFTLPQFPFVQTLGRQTQDNLNAAFVLSQGPRVQAIPPSPGAGLGHGVFAAQRDNGSGYSQQWNFTLQKTMREDWSLEVAYVGSKNTRLGLPEANLNQLPAADLSMGTALLKKVPNPYYGQLPSTSSLDTPAIAEQQLLRAYPRFTNVALFRDNVGNSTYHSAQARLEKRFAHGASLSFAYTFSKLIDDASSYFSQTIFTGPVLNNTGAADAFNRHLEKDLSSGDIPRVFSAGWVYRIPRIGKVSGWDLAGLVRIQSGDTVSVTQATNNNASLGFAMQRPNRIADPNAFSPRSAGEWFNTAAFTLAPQFTLGTSSRNPVRGPGLQQADLMLSKTFRVTERFSTEFRAEAFNVTNTPPLNDPNGSFGSAAFGTITSAGNPRDFEFAVKTHF